MGRTFELSEELINATLNYLGTQPYQQVAALIQGIQREAQAQIQPEPPIETSEEA